MSRDRARRAIRIKDEAGTSTLEVAGLLTTCLIVLLVLMQAGLALYSITATETAARQAARAYSLDQPPYGAAVAALPGWLEPEVSTFGLAHGVTVVTEVPTLVPGVTISVTRSAELP